MYINFYFQADLPGFFDTCIGEPKHLTVQYLFRNTQHLCTVADDKPLILPRNGECGIAT